MLSQILKALALIVAGWSLLAMASLWLVDLRRPAPGARGRHR